MQQLLSKTKAPMPRLGCLASNPTPVPTLTYAQICALERKATKGRDGIHGKAKGTPRSPQVESVETGHKPETVAKWQAVCEFILSNPDSSARDVYTHIGGDCNQSAVWAAIRWGNLNGYASTKSRTNPPRYRMQRA